MLGSPPVLHLKLELNHVLKALLNVWPELRDWLTQLHMLFEPYHGETLEGNDVTKVLKNLDKLEEVLPVCFSAFLDFFNDFKKVIDSVFGVSLDPNYRSVLENLIMSFNKLRSEFGVSETPKLHIVFTHVQQFVAMTGRGLGEFSEQELENSHSAFQEIWSRYLVKDISSEQYLNNYHKAFLNLNSNNM